MSIRMPRRRIDKRRAILTLIGAFAAAAALVALLLR